MTKRRNGGGLEQGGIKTELVVPTVAAHRAIQLVSDTGLFFSHFRVLPE